MTDPLARIPLASLRVFEAAARLGGFTRAAAELGMTQAAVSWQIKALEQRLGQPLFRRLPREVVPTPAGERLASAAGQAITLLKQAIAELGEADQSVLSVTTLHTFASQWLAPRLGRFQLANPDIAVRVDTEPGVIDLTRDARDVGLRSGSGDWPGTEAVPLMPNVFTPLCRPDLIERLGGLERAEALRDAPLIGEDDEWAVWFAAAGLAPAPSRGARGFRADNQALEMAAAMAGQGVALGSPVFWRREIEAGLLARPFPTVARLFGDYWLAWPKGRGRTPKIARFRQWLLDEAAADPSIAETRALLRAR